MPEYLVHGYLTISVFATVKAKNEAEAREKAGALDTPSLCHQCEDAGSGADGTWELNGFDDPPKDAVVSIEKA